MCFFVIYVVSLLCKISHNTFHSSSIYHTLLLRYNLINIKINRSYYVKVTAPNGWLFSGGVCNNDIPGRECPHSSANKFAEGYRADTIQMFNTGGYRRGLRAKGIPDLETIGKPTDKELELGIQEGRSIKCVSIDRTGMPDSRLDLGVMRIGDVKFDDTDVELKLDLIQPKIEGRGRERERSLSEVISERVWATLGRELQSNQVQLKDGMYVYELKSEDKEAIGIVTSEVSCVFCLPSMLFL